MEANYFTILWWFLPCIDMNQPRVYMCPLLLNTRPPHPIPLGCPSALALSDLFHASNLDRSSVSQMVIHMFQCYSLKSPSRIMFAVGLSYIAFIMLRYLPSIPAFWKVFIIKGCWILSKAFSASIEMFLSFSLLILCITLIYLCILKNPCIPGINPTNPTWSWCMSFLMCCWILFAKILLKIFASMFISDTGL